MGTCSLFSEARTTELDEGPARGQQVRVEKRRRVGEGHSVEESGLGEGFFQK